MRQPESHFDYFSSLERKVGQALRVAGVRFKHGIATDGIHPPEALKLRDGLFYIPDFILLEYSNVIVECKDFNLDGALTNWERKWDLLQLTPLKVILVVPNEGQARHAKDYSHAWLPVDRVHELSALIRLLSVAGELEGEDPSPRG